MLILVGVTVTVALNGGLFTTAKHAANRTTEEKERELIQAAFVDYIAEKTKPKNNIPIPEELEIYFLGTDKSGKNIEEFDIDSFHDDEEDAYVTIFKNVNEENDSITVIDNEENAYEEGEYFWYCFDYKDNRYRIGIDTEEETVKKIEGFPSLEVQYANTTKNGTKGWDVTFIDSGNTYFVTNDGRILKPWWRATDEEKSQMKVESEIYYYVSEGDNPYVGFDTKDEDYQNCALVIMFDSSSEIYVFPLTKAYAQELQELTGVNCERFNWYHASDDLHFNNFSEYSGVCPISLDDFTDEQIYCKSYLERIINSFNK